jgi:hypothetical protein
MYKVEGRRGEQQKMIFDTHLRQSAQKYGSNSYTT